MKINPYLILLFFSTAIYGPIHGQNAQTLLEKMDILIAAPKDKEADVLMIIKDKNGTVKEREATLKQKGKYKKLYRYTKPEKQSGIATLSLPDNVIWLYMPAFGKAIRISLLSKSQAFNGTDFSQEDMSGIPYSERYEPSLISQQNDEYYQLELLPKSKKSKYTKINLTMDKNHYYPIKMEYYTKGDKLMKIAEFNYQKQGAYWFAKEIVMTTVLKEHATTIILSEVKFDQGLSDAIFTIENLKKEE